MKKLLAILLALILCLSFVAGCSEEKNLLDTTIIATVDGIEISQAEFNAHYYIYYSQYSQSAVYFGEDWIYQDAGDGQTWGDIMKNSTKNEIEIFVTASIVAEERYGITAEDVKDKVDGYFDELVKSYGTKETFNSFLASANTTENALRKYFERYEILTLLAEKMSGEGGEINITEEEVKLAFDTQYSGKLKVQHILISTIEEDGVTPLRSDEEALEIAKEVIGRLDAGEDFASLIEAYNEDPGMTPGNYYVFGDGEMVAEFETASKALSIGEYTKQAVKTSYGYHIIKRYLLDESGDEYKNVKFALLHDRLYSIIEPEAQNKTFNWDDEKIDSHITTWIEEMATQNSSMSTIQ